jgi:hypothetical protein
MVPNRMDLRDRRPIETNTRSAVAMIVSEPSSSMLRAAPKKR